MTAQRPGFESMPDSVRALQRRIDEIDARFQRVIGVGSLTTQDLSDVSSTVAPVNRYILKYDGVTSEYVPSPDLTGLGYLTLEYRIDIPYDSTPASGDVSLDNLTPASTTTISISDFQLGGAIDLTIIWESLSPGDRIRIQERGDPDNYAEWELDGLPTDQTGSHDIPVDGSTALVGSNWGLSNNDRVAVFIHRDASEGLPYLPLSGGVMTGAIEGASGTAIAPGYTFSADPNVGLYRAGTDILGIATGGTLRGSWNAVGTLSVYPSHADGRVALHLGIERTWEFRQALTGASAKLRLFSTSNKTLEIGNDSSGLFTQFVDGKVRADAGTVGLPSHSFWNDQDSGMYWVAANDIGLAIGGSARITVNGNGFNIKAISSTGSAANLFIDTTTGNRVQRVTSARRYKRLIDYKVGDYLADIELKPARFWRDDDEAWYVDFIAEDLTDQDRIFGIYGEDGRVENYHKPAVLAVLAAKVARLDSRLSAVEGSR